MKFAAAILCAVLLFSLSGCKNDDTDAPSKETEATAPAVTGVPVEEEKFSAEEAKDYIINALPRLNDDSYSLKLENEAFVLSGESDKEYYLFTIYRRHKSGEILSGYTAFNAVNGEIFIYYPDNGRLVPWMEDSAWGTGTVHTMETVRTYDWDGTFKTEDSSATLKITQKGRYYFTFSIEIDTALGSFVLEELEASIKNVTATNEMNNAVYEDPDGDFTLQFTFLSDDSLRIQCDGHPFSPDDILPDGVYARE